MKELLRANGRPYGVDLFGSLPTETTNHCPHLLSSALLKQAYWAGCGGRTRTTELPGSTWRRSTSGAWWSQTICAAAWTCFLACRPWTIPLPSPAGSSAVRAESKASADHVRQRLFDHWFAKSYETYP